MQPFPASSFREGPPPDGPVLVTGGTGFAGRHLLALLTASGTEVVAWHRPSSDPPRVSGVRWMAVDLLDRASVRRATAQVAPGRVYHLAGAAHVGRSWQRTLETYQANVLATYHLLAALADVQPKARVLVTCSGAVYRPQDRPITEDDPVAPSSPYAVSKLAQEMLARQAWRDDGVPTLVARAFNHTGPGQDPSYVAPGIARQIARIEAGLQPPTLRIGNLDSRRDLSDVRDVVRAYVAMMERARAGQPYNVCSGREISIRMLLDVFLSQAQVAITVEQDPALFRPSDAPLLVGSHARLTADTDWTPKMPLEQTVMDLLDDWRTRVARSG